MVFSCLYQAKPSTPTAVILPPKHPNLSTRTTFTPVLAAANAADNPPGPDPTTQTSVSVIISISLEGSSINFFINFTYN